MRRKKKERRLISTQKRTSPAAKVVEAVSKKYIRYHKSPSKGQSVRRALFDVKTKK